MLFVETNFILPAVKQERCEQLRESWGFGAWGEAASQQHPTFPCKRHSICTLTGMTRDGSLSVYYLVHKWVISSIIKGDNLHLYLSICFYNSVREENSSKCLCTKQWAIWKDQRELPGTRGLTYFPQPCTQTRHRWLSVEQTAGSCISQSLQTVPYSVSLCCIFLLSSFTRGERCLLGLLTLYVFPAQSPRAGAWPVPCFLALQEQLQQLIRLWLNKFLSKAPYKELVGLEL